MTDKLTKIQTDEEMGIEVPEDEAQEAQEGSQDYDSLKTYTTGQLNQIRSFAESIRTSAVKMLERFRGTQTEAPTEDQAEALEELGERLATDDQEMQAVLLDAEEEAFDIMLNIALRDFSNPDLSQHTILNMAEEFRNARPEQIVLLIQTINEHHPDATSQAMKALKLSNKKILEVVQSFPKNERQDLLSKFGVAVSEQTVTPDDIKTEIDEGAKVISQEEAQLLAEKKRKTKNNSTNRPETLVSEKEQKILDIRNQMQKLVESDDYFENDEKQERVKNLKAEVDRETEKMIEQENVETIEKLQSTSRELSDYIVSHTKDQINALTDSEGNLSNPEDARKLEQLQAKLERENERRKIEDELHGEIEISVGLDVKSNNDVQVMYFKERGGNRENLPGVYKPKSGEKMTIKNIEARSFYKREWLAFQIDRILDFDVVPPTIVREGPDGIGSVQDWHIGKTLMEIKNLKTSINQKHLEFIAALDVLIVSMDRHKRNIVVAPNGTAKGIDNGYILGDPEDVNTRSVPQDMFAGKMFSEDVNEIIEEFSGSLEKVRLLKKCFEAAIVSDNPKAPSAEQSFGIFMKSVDSLSTLVIPISDWTMMENLKEGK